MIKKKHKVIHSDIYCKYTFNVIFNNSFKRISVYAYSDKEAVAKVAQLMEPKPEGLQVSFQIMTIEEVRQTIDGVNYSSEQEMRLLRATHIK